MLKSVFNIAKFAVKHPRSFVYANLWAIQEAKRRPLVLVADVTGSDKGFRKHLYTRIYDDLFSIRKDIVNNFLEIGLLCHSDQEKLGTSSFVSAPSLQMWAEYFANANVYGFDIRDFSKATGNWKAIVQGDQSQRDDLRKVADGSSSFDVIIDDALHASLHQQVSFSFLFPHLSPGGLYVIEDLHFQPPGSEAKDSVKTIEHLEELANRGVWMSSAATEEEKRSIENGVDSVTFYDSMSDGVKTNKAIAVIQRKS